MILNITKVIDQPKLYLKLDLDYQSSFELIRSQLSNITHQAVITSQIRLEEIRAYWNFVLKFVLNFQPAMLITESDIRDIQNRGLLLKCRKSVYD